MKNEPKDTVESAALAVTHIAGLDITLSDRFRRQRCAWCDKVILDEDFARMGWVLNEDGTDPGPPGAWPVGRLIRVKGPVTSVLTDDAPLPDDFCGIATLGRTRRLWSPFVRRPVALPGPFVPTPEPPAGLKVVR